MSSPWDEIVGPPSSKQGVRVDVDGRDVTGSFAVRGDGRLLGLVEGLKLGKNVLTARKPGATGRGADIHTDYHSYSLRERLEKANGHADNQIIWTWANLTGLLGIGAPPAIANESFLLMDKWLAAVEADTSSDPLEVKIVRNKPQDAVSACWLDSQGTGPKVTDPSVCRAAFPYYANPRIAAGEPFTNDVLKCQLKPLDPLDPDYRMLAVPFTPIQWARLQATFPTGVCDWTKPGADQVPSVPWLTYGNGPGGQPLGPPPVSKPF